MTKIDYLVIGQGLSGSFLSYYLLEQGASCKVIDDAAPYSASRIASGMINPVTGRIVVTTWIIHELMEFSLEAYEQLGKKLNASFITAKDILTIPPSQQMEEALAKRVREKNSFIEQVTEEEKKLLTENFHFYFEPRKIKPAYVVQVPYFLQVWKNYLQKMNCLEQRSFDFAQLEIKPDGITYQNLQAQKIIFCNGVQTFNYPPWKNLPYTTTKGEALIAEIPVLNRNYLYKYGALTLSPWEDNSWWVGSSFDHQYPDLLPSAQFRQVKETELNNLLKASCHITNHLASVRPGCIERKPFVGIHPHQPSFVILNGMGTKGCSLAPYFAHQLAAHLLTGKPIEPLADITRFEKILKRS